MQGNEEIRLFLQRQPQRQRRFLVVRGLRRLKWMDSPEFQQLMESAFSFTSLLVVRCFYYLVSSLARVLVVELSERWMRCKRLTYNTLLYLSYLITVLVLSLCLTTMFMKLVIKGELL